MNKMRYLRIGAALAVLVAVLVCTVAHVPVGTLCALCPVGFAELAVAGGAVPWGLLPGVLVLLAVVFLLGRVFCSWVCPTSLLRNLFGGRTPRGLTGQTGACAGCARDDDAAGEAGVAGACEAGARADGGAAGAGEAGACEAPARSGRAVANPNAARTHNNLASQGVVLAVLLVMSFIVHFPVFCLICPVGLVFGTLFAASRLLVTWQPGWELLVFPAMLLLEVFVLRRWCSAICPLGFFFGLMAKLRSRLTFLPDPRARKSVCLHSEGCNVCATVCPEDISAATAEPHDLEDCTLCLDCREHCPTRAISLKVPKE